MSDISSRAALIIIDVQNGFEEPVWGTRNNPEAENNIARLLEEWRRIGRPVIHVKHMSQSPSSPLRPGQSGNEIKQLVAPRFGEPVLEKQVNSAFIGTRLEAMLREQNTGQVVITGLTTNHCVSTSARMAANLGFSTTVVSDACATFAMKGRNGRMIQAEEMHEVGLAELDGEFATIAETDEVIEGSRKG